MHTYISTLQGNIICKLCQRDESNILFKGLVPTNLFIWYQSAISGTAVRERLEKLVESYKGNLTIKEVIYTKLNMFLYGRLSLLQSVYLISLKIYTR